MQTISHTDEEIIEAFILKCDVCFVGVVDSDNRPYVLPMNFGYRNNVIYLHSAPEGRIVDVINNNNNVCVAFSTDHELAFQHPEVACSYRMKSKSVIAFGKVQFIEEMEGKQEALNVLMNHYSEKEFKYSEPALKNVKVWKIAVDKISCKEFGAPHDDYKIHRSVESVKNKK